MIKIFLTKGTFGLFEDDDVITIINKNGYEYTSVKEEANLFILSDRPQKDIIDYCLVNYKLVTYDSIFCRNLKYKEYNYTLEYLTIEYKEDDKYYLTKIARNMFDDYGYGSVESFNIYNYEDIKTKSSDGKILVFPKDIFEVEL